jgi:phosphate transport system permease protein
MTQRTSGLIIRNFFLVMGLTAIVILGLIVLFLFKEGLPIFKTVTPEGFLLGLEWYPTYDPPSFGIFPLIVASVAVTFCSSLLAVPLGVLAAIYTAELADRRIKELLKPVIELLAAMPSVVIGFFGMVIVAPLLQGIFDIPTGLNILNASIMLALMAIPTITSVSEDAIYSVPQALRDASYALGATKWETTIRVTVPAALSGICTAVILGIARAIGETMVVLMVAGGAAMVPHSIFDPVRPMPASIAAEMGEAPFHSNHYYALFATGIVLFFVSLFFNILADHITHRYKESGAAFTG